MSERLLGLVGPTATGKTGIGIEIAEQIGAEIVCLDAFTVYRGLDIGTAKPTLHDRQRVPHHLVDIYEPGTRPTVSDFQRRALVAIDEIEARGMRALLVGGSGLYFRAVVDRLEFPPTDPSIRAALEEESPTSLAQRLQELDPAAAAFIDPRNTRRVARALEVIRLTGRPFSSFRQSWDHYDDATVAGVEIDDSILRARITERLLAMLAQGFIDEVRGLLDAGMRGWLDRIRPVGYAEAVLLIDEKIDETDFLEQAARSTWRLTRRQLAWFRKDPRVRWFDASEPGRAAAEIRAYYGSSEGDGWSS